MADGNISMSGPMVLALQREIAQAGTGKTMTRRLAWTERKLVCGEKPTRWQKVKPGDRLYVKEDLVEDRAGWLYAADHTPITMDQGDPRVPAMVAWAHHRERDTAAAQFMPRWASRITLIVTATKMERLQEISAEDVIAEGIDYEKHRCGCEACSRTSQICPATSSSLIMEFADLWRSLHGACAWDANPDVVCIGFKPVLSNIDALAEAA